MKRRNFLKSSALASTAFMTPAFLRGNIFPKIYGNRSGKTLVVIQLSGGNDGLNTVIPFEDDTYYNVRPTLAIPKKEVLKLGTELGLHPALSPLRGLFDDGHFTIINNVGYPNPDRSHFRSMDIWQTASGSDEYLSTGWIGRYLDHDCQGKPAYHALEVDDGLSLAMKGETRSGFAMSSAQRIRRAADNQFLQAVGAAAHPSENNVAYLYKTLTETQESAGYLFEKSKTHRSKATYPNGKFAEDLKQIAELMTADTDTKIYYVSLGGFDTHAGQLNRQQRLFKEYAEAVAAFTEDLKLNNLLDDTLIMTFSEFGRRVKQNSSGGTDHGTANNVFLMGGQLKKAGFYNAAPDLSNLEEQDLIFDIDFRRVYASILDKWLEADAAAILKGDFEGLGFV